MLMGLDFEEADTSLRFKPEFSLFMVSILPLAKSSSDEGEHAWKELLPS